MECPLCRDTGRITVMKTTADPLGRQTTITGQAERDCPLGCRPALVRETEQAQKARVRVKAGSRRIDETSRPTAARAEPHTDYTESMGAVFGPAGVRAFFTTD